jgi:hypothetical protein
MFILTIILILACSTLDYKNLPYLVGKYLIPACGNLSFFVKYGNLLIALMVGVYTCLALVFDADNMVVNARTLVIWLLVEISLSLSLIFKRDREKNG